MLLAYKADQAPRAELTCRDDPSVAPSTWATMYARPLQSSSTVPDFGLQSCTGQGQPQRLGLHS